MKRDLPPAELGRFIVPTVSAIQDAQRQALFTLQHLLLDADRLLIQAQELAESPAIAVPAGGIRGARAGLGMTHHQAELALARLGVPQS
jgi:hypothetical protein